MDWQRASAYNALAAKKPWFPRVFRALGVFAHLVMALVFKTSGGFEQSSQWIRFPYTPANYDFPIFHEKATEDTLLDVLTS